VNNEIASLKRLITALENNDYVTGVETLENGYKITFSKSGSITIHNGKDGADGEDGKDGYTPIRSEEHTSELQSRFDLVCRLLLAAYISNNHHRSLHDALPILSTMKLLH